MPTKPAKRTKSSKNWLKEHFEDPYVQRSWKDGYRSRAAYKLLEIQETHKIIKPGMVVVDLGAAPGSWSQLARQWVGKKGEIIAMDILAIEPLEHVTFLQGDFTESATEQKLLEILDGRAVDIVLSDMAPNMSGTRSVDQAKLIYLLDLAMDFADKTLKPGGDLLMKLFHGEGFDQVLKNCRAQYHQVSMKKPEASRDRSRESYLLARNKKL